MTPAGFAIHDAEAEQGHACAICQTPISRGERVGACPSCEAPYHADCWQENGGCASYGCAQAPGAAPQDADAPPAEGSSYWGQEDKACPACGRRIRLAALRCRHCGHVLPSRTPDGAGEARPQSAGSAAVVLFVLGLVPCTAPLALLVGGPLLLLRRRAVRRWPATRRAMAVTGIIAAGVITLVLAGAVILFRATGPGA